MSFAAVVLAHADPVHLHRLVDALEDVPVVLQCDATTSEEVFGAMAAGLPSRVTIGRRIPMWLASWSLVKAELAGLQIALAASDAEHIGVLSGADYPLVSMPELRAELSSWRGRSWLYNAPVPHQPWSTPRHPDGGLWRVRYRYLNVHDRLRYLGRFPVRSVLPRRIPADLELRAGSQWKIYSRQDAQTLLAVVASRPDLVRFWRSTLVPDEGFAASVLASPKVTGREPLAPCGTHPWFFAWEATTSDHPEWLRTEDLPAIRAAQRQPRADPNASPNSSVHTDWMSNRKLFARKFRTGPSDELLDALDTDRSG